MERNVVLMCGGRGFPDRLKKIMEDAGLETGDKYFVVLEGTLANRRAIARMAGRPVPTR